MNENKESSKNRDSSFDGSWVDPVDRVKRTLGAISEQLPISNISLKKGGQDGNPSYGFQFYFWSRSTYKQPYAWRQVTATPGYEGVALGDIRYPHKGDSGTVTLFEYKARELADKLKTYRKGQFGDEFTKEAAKIVDAFWLWIDQVFSGKQSAVEPDSPLMADVVAKLKAVKGELTTWERDYVKNLPNYDVDTRLLACLEQLPVIFAKADGKATRLIAMVCWRAIAGLPGVKGSLAAQKILDFVENQVEHELPPKVQHKTRIPNDREIFKVWEIGFDPERWLNYQQPYSKAKKGYRVCSRPDSYEVSKRARWAFLMLATYGLRVHELSHVANWTNPVTLQNGDWVSYTFNDELSNGDDDDDDGKNDKVTDWQQLSVARVIPAWNDPTIPSHKRFLCIKSDTKTGWRIAAPLSPVGQDWVQLLLDTAEEMDAEWGYLPYSEDGCGNWKGKGSNQQNKFSSRTCAFMSYSSGSENRNRILWEKVYGNDWETMKFSAHKLRHAFIHRARAQGYSFDEICRLTGHKRETCENVYYKHVADENAMAAKLHDAEKFADKANQPNSPKLSLDSAVAVASSLMDEVDTPKALIALLGAIYGLKADELPINR